MQQLLGHVRCVPGEAAGWRSGVVRQGSEVGGKGVIRIRALGVPVVGYGHEFNVDRQAPSADCSLLQVCGAVDAWHFLR